MRCPNCEAEISDAGQRFCGACGAPLTVDDAIDGKMRKRILDEAWEAGKAQGRKEEREREINETKTFLWASIVLGAIGGGAVAAQSSRNGAASPGTIAAGVLIGGILGGLHFFLGCFLTIVIFVIGMVAFAASVVK